MKVSIDGAWLREPQRKFPVVLDPSTDKTYTLFDTYAISTSPTGTRHTETSLAVGSWNSVEKARSFINFDGDNVDQHFVRVRRGRSPDPVHRRARQPVLDHVQQTGTGADAATVARTFGYDDAGRITSLSVPGGTNAITYDDRGLPLSITGPADVTSYTYNSDGKPTSRTDAAGATNFTYDTAMVEAVRWTVRPGVAENAAPVA